MELTDSNISTLSEYLKHTLNPDVGVRRPAEKFLESVEVNKNYPLLLLYLVDNSEIDLTIRVAGSVAFKNYVKRNWGVVSLHNNMIFIKIIYLLHYFTCICHHNAVPYFRKKEVQTGYMGMTEMQLRH